MSDTYISFKGMKLGKMYGWFDVPFTAALGSDIHHLIMRIKMVRSDKGLKFTDLKILEKVKGASDKNTIDSITRCVVGRLRAIYKAHREAEKMSYTDTDEIKLDFETRVMMVQGNAHMTAPLTACTEGGSPVAKCSILLRYIVVSDRIMIKPVKVTIKERVTSYSRSDLNEIIRSSLATCLIKNIRYVPNFLLGGNLTIAVDDIKNIKIEDNHE